MRSRIAELTEVLLQEGQDAQDILNLALMPAIDEVGILFDKGTYFLPQLINSAEAMKLSIAVLEPHLAGNDGGKVQACIVIATVKGDIHDIGKNLVALMLKNHGFRVIDLGKDVESEQIINTARQENADVIALSALMTTTMMQMKEVVCMAHEQGLSSKIIIGGAVITQDFADEIGADGYSRDAAEAVVVVKKLLGIDN
ncbi:MAG: corrinoid protein [Lachnospiraceae bacterium]|nr:corrinoid protein [Lachnospiraceae bacterium]